MPFGNWQLADLFIDSYNFEPDLTFKSLSHDRPLLPIDFEKSLSDPSKCSRGHYGFTVHDVFTETYYSRTLADFSKKW